MRMKNGHSVSGKILFCPAWIDALDAEVGQANLVRADHGTRKAERFILRERVLKDVGEVAKEPVCSLGKGTRSVPRAEHSRWSLL